MNLILDLSLHGSVIFVLVWVLDTLLVDRMSTLNRKWWWVVIPFAFLATIRAPILPTFASPPLVQAEKMWPPLEGFSPAAGKTTGDLAPAMADLVFVVWLAGAMTYLLVVAVQTRMALRRWSRERLCTDSALLDLLEDSKQEAGVTAPIGLVISENVSAPAILGWLRPPSSCQQISEYPYPKLNCGRFSCMN